MPSLSRKRRVGNSLMSLLVAVLISSSGLSAVSLWEGNTDLLFSFALGAGISAALAVPAWLMALPMILLVLNPHGRRFWFVLAAGTSLGPIVMLALAICLQLSVGAFGLAAEAWNLIYFSALVSFLATLGYLLLCRWQDRKTRAE